MDGYLRSLERTLTEFQPDFKLILTSNEEIILKENGYEREKEAQCLPYGTLTAAENCQKLADGFDSQYLAQTLPENVCLRKSSILEKGYSIWSDKEIPRGVRFGPYEGTVVFDVDTTHYNGYCWEILEDKNSISFVNAENEFEANWLRYINFASSEEEQNLIAIQCDGEIYYETTKTILPNTELLVWYGGECKAEIRNENTDNGKKLVSKWKNLKDNYARSLKKQIFGSAAKARKYIYAEQLSFLNVTACSVERPSSLTDGDNIEEEAADSQNVLNVSLEKDDPLPSSKAKDPETSSLSSSTPQLPTSTEKRRKLMEEIMIKFLTIHTMETQAEPNEDRSFFESLLPTVKQFNTVQKLDFRCEVLNIIQRIRYRGHSILSPRATNSNIVQQQFPSDFQHAFNQFDISSNTGYPIQQRLISASPSPSTSTLLSSMYTAEENVHMNNVPKL